MCIRTYIYIIYRFIDPINTMVYIVILVIRPQIYFIICFMMSNVRSKVVWPKSSQAQSTNDKEEWWPKTKLFVDELREFMDVFFVVV